MWECALFYMFREGWETEKRRNGGGEASEGICPQGKPNPTLQANQHNEFR